MWVIKMITPNEMFNSINEAVGDWQPSPLKKTIGCFQRAWVKFVPSTLYDNCLTRKIYNFARHSFNLLGIAFSPLEIGNYRFNLVSRSLKLDQEYQSFVESVKTCKDYKADHLSEEEVGKITSLFNEKLRLDNEIQNLKRDTGDSALEVSKRIVSYWAFIWSFTPLKVLGDLISMVAKLPCLVEVIDFTLSASALNQVLVKRANFRSWRSKQAGQNYSLSYEQRLIKRDEKVEFIFSAIKGQNNDCDESITRLRIKRFVDQRETHDIVASQSLRTLIEAKGKLENAFIDFRKTQAWINYGLSVISLSMAVATVAMVILCPIPGVGAVILSGLTVVSILFTLSFFIINWRMGSTYRPSLSLIHTLKMIRADLKRDFSRYWLQEKRKNNESYADLEAQLAIDEERSRQLVEERENNSWKDFIKFFSLTPEDFKLEELFELTEKPEDEDLCKAYAECGFESRMIRIVKEMKFDLEETNDFSKAFRRFFAKNESQFTDYLKLHQLHQNV